jgi:hypothetical protein
MTRSADALTVDPVCRPVRAWTAAGLVVLVAGGVREARGSD